MTAIGERMAAHIDGDFFVFLIGVMIKATEGQQMVARAQGNAEDVEGT